MTQPAGFADAAPPAPSSAQRAQQYELELRTLLLGLAGVIVCTAAVAAGITWPRMAGTLLRLLIAALALLLVGGRAWHALAHVRVKPKEYTPFEGVLAERERPAAPQALRQLTATLRLADDPAVAQRADLPWPIRRALAAELSRRLADRHSLEVGNPSHHARIRALLSEPAQQLIIPADGAAASSRQLAMSHLERILEDVEAL